MNNLKCTPACKLQNCVNFNNEDETDENESDDQYDSDQDGDEDEDGDEDNDDL